jgi:hypothetical protein
MDIVADHYQSTKLEHSDPEEEHYNPSPEEGYRYELLLCLGCKEITLRRHFNHDYLDLDEIETLYPQRGLQIAYIPSIVREAYEAALKARTIDASAYAILLRRMLEVVCEERKVKGESLSNKLEMLAKQGEIPRNLVGVARGLRLLGNKGAHEFSERLSNDEIPILDDLSKAILEYLYIAPYLAKQAETRLKKMNRKRYKSEESRVDNQTASEDVPW